MKRIIKLLFFLVGALLLFIFAAPLVAGILNLGNLTGMVLSVVIIIFGVKLEEIIALCKRLLSSKKGKAFFISFITVATALGLCFVVTLCSVISSSTTNAKDEKTVIVLGCAVRGDVPSVMLRARVDAAYKYLSENTDAVAILSGGQGSDENISEAECMYNLLTAKGIEPGRLYIEDKSTNTDENISFSKAIIEQNGLDDNIAIATSDFHLKRATMIAEKNGLSASRISSRAGFFDVPTFYVRDTIAVIKEFILG